MSIVTLAPVAVDFPNAAGQPEQPNAYCNTGPWLIGSNWYTVGAYYPAGNFSADQQLAVYSAPQNLTSSIANNAPFAQIPNPQTLYGSIIWNAFYPGSGNLIYLVGQDSTGATRYFTTQTFNVVTGAYSALSSLTAFNAIAAVRCVIMTVRPNGDQWLLFAGITGANYVLYQAVLSAGVWTLNTIDTQVTASILFYDALCVTMEASGRAHLFVMYIPTGSPVPQYLQYFPISALGVFGALTQLTVSTDVATGGRWRLGANSCMIFGDTVLFGFTRQSPTSLATRFQACVFIGTGLAAPVWSDVIVAIETSTTAYDMYGSALLSTTYRSALTPTQVAMMYFMNPTSGAVKTQAYMLTSPDGGTTWGPQTLFWDSNTLPVLQEPNGASAKTGFLGPQGADGVWPWAAFTESGSSPVLSRAFAQFPTALSIAPKVPMAGTMRSLPCVFNDFDECLFREFKTYQRIDRDALACGRVPICFSGGHVQ